MVSNSYVPILARLNMPYSENTHHAGHGDAVPNPIHRLPARELVASKRLICHQVCLQINTLKANLPLSTSNYTIILSPLYKYKYYYNYTILLVLEYIYAVWSSGEKPLSVLGLNLVGNFL